MRIARPKDFDREAPIIGRVADAARAPLQLNFDELAPGVVHAWDRIVPTDYGYIASCSCGWRSREVAAKSTAAHELRAHFGRTPAGSVLLRTLRKLGRSANGS